VPQSRIKRLSCCFPNIFKISNFSEKISCLFSINYFINSMPKNDRGCGGGFYSSFFHLDVLLFQLKKISLLISDVDFGSVHLAIVFPNSSKDVGEFVITMNWGPATVKNPLKWRLGLKSIPRVYSIQGRLSMPPSRACLLLHASTHDFLILHPKF